MMLMKFSFSVSSNVHAPFSSPLFPFKNMPLFLPLPNKLKVSRAPKTCSIIELSCIPDQVHESNMPNYLLFQIMGVFFKDLFCVRPHTNTPLGHL